MSTNHYFQKFTHPGEQNLMDELVQEIIKIHGVDVVYIMRESNENMLKRDKFFGDDYIGKFKAKFPIEMFLETADGYGGEGDLLAKFGVILRDQATFVCSRKRFAEETTREAPKEGDLIYFPITNHLFEITHVDFANPFQQFGKSYTFKITVETFQFSEEQFETGIFTIDNVPNEKAYAIYFDLVAGGSGEFTPGETVTVPGTLFSGKVSDFEEADLILKVNYPAGQEAPTTGYLLGSGSGASWGISAGDPFKMPEQPFADNEYLENNKLNIVDFSETNPFGEF